MTIRFLSKEQLQKITPTNKEMRIEDILRDNLAKPVLSRGYWKAHASDLTKPDYCPRMVAFWREAGGPQSLEKINPALAMTFKVGNLTAELITEDLGGSRVWGNWVCRHCDDEVLYSFKPKKCLCHPASSWKYKEVVFEHTTTGASGSIDAIFDLADDKLIVTELKIMSPDEFAKLLMPLWEHRIRTQVYLDIIKNSDHEVRDLINLNYAKVLYVCRTHGKQVGGRITPFKEFVVPADPEKAQPYLMKARKIKVWEETGEYPEPLCANLECDQAKKCMFREKCAEVGGFAL